MAHTKLSLVYTDEVGVKHYLTLHRMIATRVWNAARRYRHG